MSGQGVRGRFLVNLVREKGKENVSANVSSQHKELQQSDISIEKDISILTDQSNRQNHIHSPVPSTSKVQLRGKEQTDYYNSPIHSGESDIDDSDADPNFDPSKKSMPIKVVPPSFSSCSTSSSSGSSSSDSSSSSETEDEVHLGANRRNSQEDTGDNVSQYPTTAEVHQQGPIMEKKKGKKRLRKTKTWKTKVAKLLRNSGKAYQSLSKTKNQVPERKLRPPCGGKCRLNCTSNFSDPSRRQLFDSYWGLADLQRQREFIVRHSQEIKPKYRYSSTQNFRALNTAFYFEIDGTRIRVCKAFFKSTLDLNDRVIKTALSKKSESGIIEGDMRGRHGKQPTIDPLVKNSVKDFINSIPRIESHYLRAQTTREFICSDKSLADLYRDYKALREENNLAVATPSTFNRIFNTDFNISFFVPKKDQCDLCESYKNANDEEKQKLYQSYEDHLKEKTLARIEKENDKNRKDGTIVAVYDLQAVLQVPKGQVSLFFYKSRINCLNFTISDLEAKDVVCYFWDQTEGARGAVEVGSCILEYIKCLLDKNPGKELEIIFYSDNCGGQQKNKYLLSIYAYAVINMSVKSITHKFLIRGHSQNEGDNVHSVIEKQIKRHLKSGPIYSPQTYSTLIRTAKKTGRPYKVVEMTHNKFYDVKILQASWGNNFTIDEHRNQVKWHDIKVLRVEKEYPQVFFYKTSFGDETFKKTFVRNRRAANQSFISADLTLAYTEKIPLSAAKKKDIEELINKNVIPNQYYESYFKNALGHN